MGKLVQAQVELTNGQPRIVTGKVDPECAFKDGALGVLVYEPRDSRGRLNGGLRVTFIHWSQIRMVHADL
jgi:hypothetical protein